MSLVETALQDGSEALQASAAVVFAGPRIEPELMVLPDATMALSAERGDTIRFTVTKPATHAGSYELATSDLAGARSGLPRPGSAGSASPVRS